MTWKDQLKQQWNENPLAVIGTGAIVATAATAILNSLSAAQGRRAYARQVNYRVNNRI
jgi:hypothetical protein